MIFITDASGRRTHISQEWTALTGQAVGDALGLGWVDCVHPDDRDAVRALLAQAAAQAAEFSVRYRLTRADGSTIWVMAGGVPSFGPPGTTFLGYLGSITELADGAGEAMSAYGAIGRFVPPPSNAATLPGDSLDLTADHLIIAHALIEDDGGKEALTAVKVALYQIGLAIARRNAASPTLN